MAEQQSTRLPGHPSSETELVGLGFTPLHIELKRVLEQAEGGGCEWDTLGSVPEGPGHYLFTVEDNSGISVAYVGLTTHLWMVTKGRLPHSSGARGGQRYGRPKHAGATRQRINREVTIQLALGRRVRHWVRALDHAAPGTLVSGEEELIRRWNLREVGWNRG